MVHWSYGVLDEVVPEPCGAGPDEQFVARVLGVSDDSVGLLPAPRGGEVLHGFLAMCKVSRPWPCPSIIPQCLQLFLQCSPVCPVGSTLDDGVGAVVATQSCMSRGFRRDLSMQPRGAPVLRVRVEGLMLPIHMTWGLPVRKFMITAVLSPRSLSLLTSLVGAMVLNAEL